MSILQTLTIEVTYDESQEVMKALHDKLGALIDKWKSGEITEAQCREQSQAVDDIMLRISDKQIAILTELAAGK